MKTRYFLIISSVFFLTLSVSLLSCVREEDYTTDSSVSLKFSSDTLSFDTIFTTVGSVTKKVMIYNNESDAVKIDRIFLGGGQVSYYRLNIDGNPSSDVRNIDIGAKDSMAVFVRVELDVNNQNNPLLVQDSIVIQFNGKEQCVRLLAYGQDAYYHKPSQHIFQNSSTGETFTLNCSLAQENSSPLGSGVELSGNDIIWKTDKPHVVVGSCVVSGNYNLKLQDGTKVYMADNSDLTVLEGGSLNAVGSVNEPVLFTSLRTQGRYASIAGQWNGIYLSAGSKDNIMNHVEITNAVIGLTVDTCVTQEIWNNNFASPTLLIENSRIENCSLYGLYARGAVVDGRNLIVQNTGSYTLALGMGGNYRFVFCTFADFWHSNSTRTDAVLVLNDWYKAANGSIIERPLYNAEFHNCVIYGNLAKSEVEFDLKSAQSVNYQFNHCLIKTDIFNNGSSFANDCIFNLDPKFNDAYENDVSPTEDSPLVGNADGNWTYLIGTDINNNYRGFYPTIGAIEYTSTQTYARRK
ncbi:MAG: hypothetical protein IJ748_01035 [Bacteroidales bacterium]|nr:hypothetical protein [Bacteroidales bacterium]